MSARAIWEATGKDLINRNIPDPSIANKCRFAVYDGSSSWEQLIEKEPWLLTEVLYLSMDLFIYLIKIGCFILLPIETSGEAGSAHQAQR